MLQFITHPSQQYSIAEEVQMVLEGGCRWIQLRMKDATDEEVREVALELIPMCQETDAFLIIDDRVNLVNDLRVSGVHLGKNDMPPLEARELLGPHAVIGVTANTVDDILPYKGKDIDYIGLGPFAHTTTKSNLSPILGTDSIAEIITHIRQNSIELPVVAVGGIKIEDIPDLLKAGVNGIAMSSSIINSDDPVLYTKRVIDILQQNS